jgi:1-acyl-sn-glycerol-3-phosphate acyltransferase
MNYKKIIKLFLFVLFILSFFACSTFILIFNFFSFDRARTMLVKNISIHSNIGLKLLGIKVKAAFSRNINDENFLLVSNHHSYVDILVIASFFPACFVTSYEMKETLFLGQLCSLGGCLFVERRSRAGLSKEVMNLTAALKNKLNVVVFPEATSTNGEALLKFKRPLFQAALDAKKEVLPICLNYLKVNHERITKKNRDSVFWYGDATFFPHFLNFLEQDEVLVELSVLDRIELDESLDKDQLANLSYQAISSEFKPIVLAEI